MRSQVFKMSVIAFALVMTMFSCQREAIVADENQSAPGIQNSSSYEFVQLDLDRTQTYLEELINYDQANAEETFNKIYLDEQKVRVRAFFDEEQETHLVPAEDLEAAFDDLRSLALTAADRIDFGEGESRMILADVKEPTFIEEISGGGVYEMNVTFLFAQYIIRNCNFGPQDYWLHWNDLGGCGPNSASFSDAAEEIELNANQNLCRGISYCRWFKNISAFMVTPSTLNPNDPVPGDGYLDTYTYKGPPLGPTALGGCLDPTEMNFHRNGVYIEANHYLNLLNLPGHIAIAYDLQGDLFFGSNGTLPTHQMTFWHGKCSFTHPTP